MSKISQENNALNIISAISASSSIDSCQLVDILESIPDAIFIKDAEGRWIANNSPARLIFKLNFESWVGLTDLELSKDQPWLKGSYYSFHEGDELAWKSSEPSTKIEVIPSISDEIGFIHLKLLRVPIYNNDGSRKFLLSIGRDITESILTNENTALSLLKINQLNEISNAGNFVWDLLNSAINFSNKALSMLQIEHKEAQQFNYADLLNMICVTDKVDFNLAIKTAITKTGKFNLSTRASLPSKDFCHINILGEVIYDANGNANKIVGSITDLTKNRELAKDLILADRVFDHSNDGIIITDDHNVIVKVNRMFSEITGIPLNDAIGRSQSDLSLWQYNEEFNDNILKSIKKNGYWRGEVIGIRKSGEHYITLTTISTLSNDYDELTNYVTVFSDVSAHNESLNKLSHLSNHDLLTGLPNRSLLYERVAQSIQLGELQHTSAALLHLDVDQFKLINDSYGNAVGDLVLKEISARLMLSSGTNATVARIGGDEFLIVLPAIKYLPEVKVIANAVIDSFSKKISVGSLSIPISVSIGIATYPIDAKSAEDLITRAGMAMCHAKNIGRGHFQFFDQEMNVNVLKRLYIENGLKTALLLGELKLYYQPQIDINTEKIIGFEALVRWFHPELGLIPPDGFISIAEETGMIVKIGEWAILEACQQVVEWKKIPGYNIPVAVNISSVQFNDIMLESVIVNALKETGLPASFLEIEITESVIMNNLLEAVNKMKRIQGLGVKISIDDFGTGYSSLSYLKSFHVDKIKIDKTFISDSEIDVSGQAIIAAIISMSKSLNLKVIAEGVETKDQFNLLKALGCDEMQGFYYSRPIPSDSITSLLLSKK